MGAPFNAETYDEIESIVKNSDRLVRAVFVKESLLKSKKMPDSDLPYMQVDEVYFFNYPIYAVKEEFLKEDIEVEYIGTYSPDEEPVFVTRIEEPVEDKPEEEGANEEETKDEDEEDEAAD